MRKELEAERDRHRQTLDAERQKFEERLRATQEQATAVKDELEAERDHHRLAIDDIERAHEAVLAAQAKDAQSAARAAQARYEQNMAEAQAERDTLLGNVQEWEQRYTQALESRRVERDEFEDALETARRRNDQLREAQEDWRRELGRTLEGLTGVADRATALLTRGEGKPVVTARPRAATPLKVAAPTVAAPEADVEMDSVEITPWEF